MSIIIDRLPGSGFITVFFKLNIFIVNIQLPYLVKYREREFVSSTVKFLLRYAFYTIPIRSTIYIFIRMSLIYLCNFCMMYKICIDKYFLTYFTFLTYFSLVFFYVLTYFQFCLIRMLIFALFNFGIFILFYSFFFNQIMWNDK